jgi:cysteine/O-acetylserine efflux protein
VEIDFLSLASFALITTFTPGPNNISSASMGILHGYRKTLNYLLGIISGFFLIMLLSGWISAALLNLLPNVEGVLRIVGAIYILWLAFHTLKASYAFDEEEQHLLGYPQGFLLQLLNPKAIIYGLVLYSTFLPGIGAFPVWLLISVVALTAAGFCAISTWALFGAAIRTYLDRPRVKQMVNTGLALLLVWTAIELSGVLGLIFSST